MAFLQVSNASVRMGPFWSCVVQMDWRCRWPVAMYRGFAEGSELTSSIQCSTFPASKDLTMK